MSTQNTTTLTQEDSEILNGILSSAVADYFYADSTDYRAMQLRMASPGGFNAPPEELVCLEIAEGITFREWCDGCDAAPRFWAQWIAKQFHDENGEWIPDNDEYQQRLCRDVETAKRVAIDEGKRCNVVEWARVCEENFNPEVNIPAWHSAAWDTVRVWHGDWQGNWDEESWS